MSQTATKLSAIGKNIREVKWKFPEDDRYVQKAEVTSLPRGSLSLYQIRCGYFDAFVLTYFRQTKRHVT